MKITFEGKTFRDISDEMESLLTFLMKNIPQDVSEKANKSAIPSAKLAGPGPSGPDPVPEVIAPVDKPVDKPVESASDKMAKVRAARGKKPKVAATPFVGPEPPFVEPATLEQAAMDPAEIVKIRAQTIEELQSAYANGLQKEVFELLSRFGNGAKSFRELPPEAFMPIRQAIDNGALT